MNAILAAAEAILHRHPAPALRMADLLARLQTDGPDPRLRSGRLRRLLERDPDRFRVLDVWRGPWRPLRERTDPDEMDRSCWVAVVSENRDPPGGDVVAARMRESVRWLARRLDVRSLHEVTRWYRLALADEAARAALGDRAA